MPRTRSSEQSRRPAPRDGVTWSGATRVGRGAITLAVVLGALPVVASGAVLPGSTYDQAANPNSLYTNALLVDASDNAWGAGLTGKGIDVAVIDTGVNPVQGLDAPGKVINGPDLSFDAPNATRRYRDYFGHGTHMAGIIAANDAPNSAPTDYANHPERLTGIAPDARILNMKVGDSNGVVDVTQVIAALSWLTQHKSDPGLNVRVVVLAYGTDSTQDYRNSPLAHAVEQAWKAGLVVLVASGNRSKLSGQVNMPANDPTIIAVGASDTRNTFDISDDNVALFSSSGRGGLERSPDVVAPGVSIPSLRVPNSALDRAFCGLGCVGTRYFKGTGTSQATALVGGVVAILLQQRPGLTPDQVKAMLKNSVPLAGEDARSQGYGRVDLDILLSLPTPPNAPQAYQPATGRGSIDADRGSMRPTLNGRAISGEVDIFGKPFAAATLASRIAARTSWTGGSWNGSTWTGSTWTGLDLDWVDLDGQHVDRLDLDRLDLDRLLVDRQQLDRLLVDRRRLGVRLAEGEEDAPSCAA